MRVTESRVEEFLFSGSPIEYPRGAVSQTTLFDRYASRPPVVEAIHNTGANSKTNLATAFDCVDSRLDLTRLSDAVGPHFAIYLDWPAIPSVVVVYDQVGFAVLRRDKAAS